MEFYEIMMGINSFLLFVCLGLVGAIWSGMQKEKAYTREDFKEIWKSIHKQNEAIQQSISLSNMNQRSIEGNQREIMDIQQDIKEQNTRINKFWEEYNLAPNKR